MKCEICSSEVDLAKGGYQLVNQYEDLLFCGKACLVGWLYKVIPLTERKHETPPPALSPQDVVFCPVCDQVHPGESHLEWLLRSVWSDISYKR